MYIDLLIPRCSNTRIEHVHCAAARRSESVTSAVNERYSRSRVAYITVNSAIVIFINIIQFNLMITMNNYSVMWPDTIKYVQRA